MNCILVFAVAAILAASCYADPICQSKDVIVEKCRIDNGLDLASLDPVTQYTSKNLNRQCSQLTEYTNTMNCIADELHRCSIKDKVINKGSVQTMSKLLDSACKDQNFKFSCFDQFNAQHGDVKKCVESKTSSLAPSDPKNRCQFIAAGITCSTDIMKNCDDHTGQVFFNVMKQCLPPECSVSAL